MPVGAGGAGGGGSTVPQKRKLGLAGGGKSRAGARGASGEPLHPAPSSDWPGNGERGGSGAGERGEGGEGEGDEIRCRCGSNADDGFSIACDVCGRWCHAACFGIVEGSVPEEWACWDCVLKGLAVSSNGHAHGKGQARRRASVSGRRASTVEMERSPPTAHGHGQQGHGHGQGQHIVDGDDGFEDERSQYVSIDEDVVPHASTQRRLRAYAAKWRGVSALSSASAEPPPSGLGHTPYVFPGAPPPAHPTTLFPLFPSSSSSSAPHPAQPPAQSQSQNQSVLPPTYALHAARPARPATFLAPFPSVITPSSVYLRDPLNGYAHSGAPKRFVHLVGPPLDVCLDARGVGGRGRWVRSGCWPNAEVRAYVCGSAGGGQGRREGRGTRGKGAGKGADAEPRTHFGIFATRALRQGEEIVVGWEWDDGNAVHRVGEVVGEPGPAGVYG
ncbi:hypothetical protein B0H11DRAFT_1718335 [Mycena galericulata]|nr:hypothetical protein B0H11DRAFT_1718335 [Mycena galericulata]